MLHYPRWLVAAAVIPMFPLISAYTLVSMVEQISHIGFSDPLIEAMIAHFIMASFIVGALSIGLTFRGCGCTRTPWRMNLAGNALSDIKNTDKSYLI